MEKTYELSGHKLLVVFHDKIIQIKKPRTLKKFLSEDIELRSEILVNYIKQDYFSFIGKELKISNDSFIIEIWGHVFASHFAKAMKKLISLKLIDDAADFIIKKSGIWDITHEIILPQKIQAITTFQYPWHKSVDVGHVNLHTAAGIIHFKYGNYTEIKQLVNYWLYQIESGSKEWM